MYQDYGKYRLQKTFQKESDNEVLCNEDFSKRIKFMNL